MPNVDDAQPFYLFTPEEISELANRLEAGEAPSREDGSRLVLEIALSKLASADRTMIMLTLAIGGPELLAEILPEMLG